MKSLSEQSVKQSRSPPPVALCVRSVCQHNQPRPPGFHPHRRPSGPAALDDLNAASAAQWPFPPPPYEAEQKEKSNNVNWPVFPKYSPSIGINYMQSKTILFILATYFSVFIYYEQYELYEVYEQPVSNSTEGDV